MKETEHLKTLIRLFEHIDSDLYVLDSHLSDNDLFTAGKSIQKYRTWYDNEKTNCRIKLKEQLDKEGK